MCVLTHHVVKKYPPAAIAQLGERQSEDLKDPESWHRMFCFARGRFLLNIPMVPLTRLMSYHEIS